MQAKIVATAIMVLLCPVYLNTTLAQDDMNSRLQSVTQRVSNLEEKENQLLEIAHREAGSAVILLFGAFCALWAQNTNRSAWLWFFLGILFNVLTVIVLLCKNSQDRRTSTLPGG